MKPGVRTGAAFILLGVLFGTTYAGIKTGLADLPALFFAGLRFDLAVAGLIAVLVVKGGQVLPRTRGDVLAIGISGVFIIAANNALLFLGQGHLSPSMASVLYSLAPLITPLFALSLLDDESLTRRGAVGLVIGLVGVIVILRPGPGSLASSGGLGQALILAAATAVAAGSVLLRRVELSLPNASLAGWSMGVGALLLHGTSLLAGEVPVLGQVSSASWLWLVWVALPGTALAYVLFFHLLEEVGAIRSSLVTYIVPVFATLVGWLVFGDLVDAWTVAGFLVVVSGFAVLHWPTLQGLVGRGRRPGPSSLSEPPSPSGPPSVGPGRPPSAGPVPRSRSLHRSSPGPSRWRSTGPGCGSSAPGPGPRWPRSGPPGP